MAIASRLLARLVRTTGGRLLDRATARLIPPVADATKAKRPIASALTGAALTRIATRSVPGALVVGGGLLAKTLYDRRRKRNVQSGAEDDAGD